MQDAIIQRHKVELCLPRQFSVTSCDLEPAGSLLCVLCLGGLLFGFFGFRETALLRFCFVADPNVATPPFGATNPDTK
jgi:hypothetical protein